MLNRNRYLTLLIVTLAVAAVCTISPRTSAQQSGSQSQQVFVSDNDFISLNQQINELKSPTFRAFLRMRLLGWYVPVPNATRRQAAIQVATQGLKDLCEHQEEVWSPTASWLHGSLIKQLKKLGDQEEPSIEICALKTEAGNPANDLGAGIKMLNTPGTSAAGLTMAKSAIANGQTPPEALLGHLLLLSATNSPHFPELLVAVVAAEERRPGTLSLKLMPFFLSVFLDRSVAPEVLTRFIAVALRATRLSAEELANPEARSSVHQLLNGLMGPSQRLAPELYPEIASRLSSMNKATPNSAEARLAADERINKATDKLEQTISEANSAPTPQLKDYYFSRAAHLAKDQGQLSKAVDLILEITSEREPAKEKSEPLWLRDFLSEIVSIALRKKSPQDATYAISKMTEPLDNAKAFRLLGEYYVSDKDMVKSKQAFAQSEKQLKAAANNNEKVKFSLLLSVSVLKNEPAEAYKVFSETVKTINNLPSPEKGQEKMYFVSLMPLAEELFRSFRLLAISEPQTATNLSAEIKLSELRLAALSGALSGPQTSANSKSNQKPEQH